MGIAALYTQRGAGAAVLRVHRGAERAAKGTQVTHTAISKEPHVLWAAVREEPQHKTVLQEIANKLSFLQ